MLHGLKSASDQVEQDLLNLGSVDEHKRCPMGEAEGNLDAAVLGSRSSLYVERLISNAKN
jgi:hypothetical protein